LADEADAGLLEVPVGSPVLRCERITSDRAGRPVLLSEHVFPGHRTEFVVDLPTTEPSIAPNGLRLVE
jgi:GntR family transcriptional regulator